VGSSRRGVLVTGSTSGIGESIAARFAKEGADTVITGRDRPRGEAVAARLSALGPGRSRFIAADLATPDGPLSLAHSAEEWLNGVDVVVNNAATGVSGASEAISSEDWNAIFALNVRGPYLLSTALMLRMEERGSGVVVNVTSSVAHRGWPGYAAYSASKSALEGLTRCWAATYGPSGVRVNAVAPGPVLTPLLGDSTVEDLAQFCSGYGQGRYGMPEDVAAMVVFLASAGADYIQGSTVHVDGGMAETFGYQPIAVRPVARPRGASTSRVKKILRRLT